jgi:hypothetical protein
VLSRPALKPSLIVGWIAGGLNDQAGKRRPRGPAGGKT